MPSSPTPSPTHHDAYAQLIAALHPPPPSAPEIEILPPSFPPRILRDESSAAAAVAVGVPKALLAPLYLRARAVFSDHVSSRDPASHPAALRATAVMLLFDPNHLTAANFRKRHLQRFLSSSSSSGGRTSGGRTEGDGRGDQDAHALGDEAGAVRRELEFLEGFLTSPLTKHAKSSTLWAQRLWIVQNFFRSAVQKRASDGAIRTVDMRRGIRAFWDGELVKVMKAGERHPRNYYAWQYARQLFSIIRSERPDCVKGRHWHEELLRKSMGLVHGWCLIHPRDISGWAFLVFLLEQLRSEGRDEGDQGQRLEDEIGRFAYATKEFARKYEWKGESIEWFLKAMKTLGIDDRSTELLPENISSSAEIRIL